MKEGVYQGVAYSTYYVTKQPLAPRDISNVPAVNTINRRSAFSMYFITSLTSEYLPNIT